MRTEVIVFPSVRMCSQTLTYVLTAKNIYLHTGTQAKQMHHKLHASRIDLQVACPPLPLCTTTPVSQYAHKRTHTLSVTDAPEFSDVPDQMKRLSICVQGHNAKLSA